MGRQAIPFAWRPSPRFRAVPAGAVVARAPATHCSSVVPLELRAPNGRKKALHRADFTTCYEPLAYRAKLVWPVLRIDPLSTFA